MTTAFDALRARMKARGITGAQLADALGLDPSQVSRRMTGRVPWTLPEMYAVLRLTGSEASEMTTLFPDIV